MQTIEIYFKNSNFQYLDMAGIKYTIIEEGKDYSKINLVYNQYLLNDFFNAGQLSKICLN